MIAFWWDPCRFLRARSSLMRFMRPLHCDHHRLQAFLFWQDALWLLQTFIPRISPATALPEGRQVELADATLQGRPSTLLRASPSPGSTPRAPCPTAQHRSRSSQRLAIALSCRELPLLCGPNGHLVQSVRPRGAACRRLSS